MSIIQTAPETQPSDSCSFYDVREIQAMLKISRSTVYELIAGEDFPKLRIGSTIRIPVASFHRWVENQVGV